MRVFGEPDSMQKPRELHVPTNATFLSTASQSFRWAYVNGFDWTCIASLSLEWSISYRKLTV